MSLTRLALFLLLPLFTSGLTLQWVGDFWNAGKNEYAAVRIETHPKKHGYTWYEADDVCMKNGGYLLSIDSKAEWRQLDLVCVASTVCSGFWIGLNDLDRDGKYTWSNGQAYTSVGLGIERERNAFCYASSLLNNKLVLKPSNCGRGFAFICKRKKEDTVPKTRPTPAKVEGYCPDGWKDAGTNHSNRCYKVFSADRKLSWSKARDNCLQVGHHKANLASANTKGEIDVLTALVSGCPKTAKFWFGLQKVMKWWTWEDNTRFEASNFRAVSQDSGDNGRGFMDNGAVPPGSWDVTPKQDTTHSLYICQIEKDPDNVITTKPSSDGGDEACRGGSTGGGGDSGGGTSAASSTAPITALTVVMAFLGTFTD